MMLKGEVSYSYHVAVQSCSWGYEDNWNGWNALPSRLSSSLKIKLIHSLFQFIFIFLPFEMFFALNFVSFSPDFCCFFLFLLFSFHPSSSLALSGGTSCILLSRHDPDDDNDDDDYCTTINKNNNNFRLYLLFIFFPNRQSRSRLRYRNSLPSLSWSSFPPPLLGREGGLVLIQKVLPLGQPIQPPPSLKDMQREINQNHSSLS